MKYKKDPLLTKNRNALSSTAKLLNLKNDNFKTSRKDYKDLKKLHHGKKDKLQIALSQANLIKKPIKMKSVPKFKSVEENPTHSNLRLISKGTNKLGLSKPSKYSVSNEQLLGTAKSDIHLSSSSGQSKKEKAIIPQKKKKYANGKFSLIEVTKTNKLKSEIKGSKTQSKQQQKPKSKGWHHKKQKKSKKTKNPDVESRLDLDKVTAAVSGLFKIVETTSMTKPDLFDLEEPIVMLVECIKIPQCPTKQIRCKLPHPLVNEMSDVLLITADKKGHKPFPEKSIEHYTDLLQKHNVNFIQKVIPIRMLRQEYTQYELKKKLVDQFDLILTDAAIAKSLPNILGKFVMYKTKMPIPVHLDRVDLKTHLQLAISKTQMTVKSKGKFSSVKVGHTKMSASEIAANIVEVSKMLMHEYPGGWGNIRSLEIKTQNSLPVLVYVTLKSPNTVKPTTVIPKKAAEIVDELSTYPGKVVVVRKDGSVHIKEVSKEENFVDNSQDDEILKEAEKYIQSSRTIHYDDDSDDDNDKSSEAITKAVEQELLDKYKKKAIKTAEQTGSEEDDEEEEEEESSDEEEPAILPIGKKRKMETVKKQPRGNAQSKKAKGTKELVKPIKQKQNESTNQIQKRGSRGGKKNKMNKDQRKASIKRKKAGKK